MRILAPVDGEALPGEAVEVAELASRSGCWAPGAASRAADAVKRRPVRIRRTCYVPDSLVMRRPLPRDQRVLVLSALVGVALLAAACGGDDDSSNDAGATSPGVPTSGASASMPGSTPAPGPRQGHAVSRSDVASLPDSRITRGAVLFFPPAAAAELAAEAGLEAGDTESLRHAAFVLDEVRLVGLGGTVSPIDEDGAFTLPVEGGTHLVCLADVFVEHGQAPPYSVVGCTEAAIPDDGAITVGHGEGGVDVTVE